MKIFVYDKFLYYGIWLMKINALALFFVCTFTSTSIATNVYSQGALDKSITIELKNTDFNSALRQITKVSGVKFVYSGEIAEKAPSVTLNVKDEKLNQVLDRFILSNNLVYTLLNDDIIITPRKPRDESGAMPENINIRVEGVVIDQSSGTSIPGATIKVKGTQTATISNAEGKFSLTVPNEKAVLIVSSIGYKTLEVQATNSPLKINLEPDVNNLKEIVVVGYGTQKRKDLTGSIATLSSKDINKIPVNGVDKALQGQIAGLQITTTSAAPGGNTTILVRGISSVTGGIEPLFVIDGFPVNSVGYSNPLSTINPSDIESIDVLKDASATAIYGSRGSNGVIIVTTKRGKSGKPKLQLNSYTGLQSVAHKIEMMNASQFAEFTIAARNNGLLDNNPSADINAPNSARPASFRIPVRLQDQAYMSSIGEGTNWQDAIFRNAGITNHQLSASGGTENIKYSLSGGYFNQDGVVISTNFKRYDFRANVDAKLTKRLSTGISFTRSYTQEVSPPIEGAFGGYGIINSALAMDPTVPVYLPDGSYGSTAPPKDGEFGIINPVKIAKEYVGKSNQSRILSNAFLEYVINPAIKVKTAFGVDQNYYNQRRFVPSTLTTSAAPIDPSASSTNNISTNWLSETTISYNKTFNEIHKVDFVGGYTLQKDNINSLNAGAANFPDNQITNINGGTVNSGFEGTTISTIESYLARVNYNLKDKYLLTATIRRDGSSRFGQDKKYGNFPSASLAWRISNEAFMQRFKFISDLKIRTSYGVTGNNAIGDYRALSLLSNTNYVFGNTVSPGLSPSTLSNKLLGWESQSQINIGMDLSLFDNRINLVADVYDKRNKDMLFNIQTPGALGVISTFVNVGEVQNKGIELSLSTRNTTGKFIWNTNANISFNRNKVLSLNSPDEKIFGGRVNSNVTMVGQPIGVFYGRRAIGVFATNEEATAYGAQPFAKGGDVKWKDVNGDKIINDDDREVIGTPHPNYIFGFNNTLSYKAFSLDITTSGSIGQDVVNTNYITNNNGVMNNAAFVNDARWRSASDPGYDFYGRSVRGGKNDNSNYSSIYVFNTSYFRIRQVNLSYNLPPSIITKLKIQGMRVYAGVNNLYTFTKYFSYDPEVSFNGDVQTGLGVDFGTYPSARTGTIGINVNF